MPGSGGRDDLLAVYDRLKRQSPVTVRGGLRQLAHRIGGTRVSSVHRVLYVVVCAAGPASEVDRLVTAAQAAGWDVQLFATPAALEFLDLPALEAETGHTVRSSHRGDGQPRGSTPRADAIIVAPASFNTINKLAGGIADNYVLTMLAECIGIRVPVVLLPFINRAFADRAPLRAAVARLRSEGVRVLIGSDGFQPHPPSQGDSRMGSFPWLRALEVATDMADTGAAQ